MNIRYPIYEGVYRILTKQTGFEPVSPACIQCGDLPVSPLFRSVTILINISLNYPYL